MNNIIHVILPLGPSSKIWVYNWVIFENEVLANSNLNLTIQVSACGLANDDGIHKKHKKATKPIALYSLIQKLNIKITNPTLPQLKK